MKVLVFIFLATFVVASFATSKVVDMDQDDLEDEEYPLGFLELDDENEVELGDESDVESQDDIETQIVNEDAVGEMEDAELFDTEETEEEENDEVSEQVEDKVEGESQGNELAHRWLTGEKIGGIQVEKFDVLKKISSMSKAKGKSWTTQMTSRYNRAIAQSGKATSPLFKTPPNKFLLHIVGAPAANKKGANIDNHGLTTLTSNGFWVHFVVGRTNSKDKSTPVRIVQLLPLDVNSFGMSTGGSSCIQTEVIAADGQIFTDDADVTAAMKALYARVRQVHPSIPDSIDPTIKFKPPSKPIYDEKKWAAIKGLAGHMHHPTKAKPHTDPGLIDAAKLI